MDKQLSLFSYYFPNFHPGDPRNSIVHGTGWSEWELVKRATPRFPGHCPLPQPAWGYTDEADPEVMSQKIEAATDHGIDGFIFDWYYYDDGPFLEKALEEGFLKASNVDRIKFCCMWANHDWQNIHPSQRLQKSSTLYPGKIQPRTWERITDILIERYFSHPSHLKIDGKPYFSIYELSKLLASFGSIKKTRKALEAFREKCRGAGFPDVHLNGVVWRQPILPDETAAPDPEKLLPQLGFDSFASYVWVHHSVLNNGNATTKYMEARNIYSQYWDEALSRFTLPYVPNVTMGWDSSPRTIQSDIWEPGAGYPFSSILKGNTPEAFREAVEWALERVQTRPGHMDMLTINAWNEWTEGSYLEPDKVHGTAYLEAVREAVNAHTARKPPSPFAT